MENQIHMSNLLFKKAGTHSILVLTKACADTNLFNIPSIILSNVSDVVKLHTFLSVVQECVPAVGLSSSLCGPFQVVCKNNKHKLPGF